MKSHLPISSSVLWEGLVTIKFWLFGSISLFIVELRLSISFDVTRFISQVIMH